MKTYLSKILFTASLLLVAALLSIKFGGISLQGVSPETIQEILDLRLARVVLAMVVGCSLGLTGLVYQGILLNPLAEPYLLGISAGGALGAVIAICLGWPQFIFSIGGALLALTIVLMFARRHGKLDNNGLILTGVMINAFCSALIMLIVSIAGDKTQPLLFWLMGDIGAGSAGNLWVIIPLVFALLVFSSVFAGAIDALSFGDEQAAYLGIEVKNLKLVLFILSAFVTALVVATVGIIGFIGLVTPHIAKMLVGEHFGRALPLTLFLGAFFLVLADLLSRVIIPETILPVGIITALIGVPFFILIYKRS